jgi:protein BCP1
MYIYVHISKPFRKAEKRKREASSSEEEDEEEDLVPLYSKDGMIYNDVDDDEEDDDDQDEDEDVEIMDVDFEFVDPKEIHFHSVKRLLSNYFPDVPVSDLVNTIIEQEILGTMIQINEDVDAYGLATILPLKAYGDKESIKAVVKYISGSVPAEDRAHVTKVLEASSTGLFIHERFMNLPPAIASPLFSALIQDVDWAVKKENDEKLRKAFNFKDLILIAPCDLSGEEKDTKKPSKKRKVDEEIYFHRFEDEVFKAFASFCTAVKMAQSEVDVAKGSPPQYKAIMVIPFEALKAAISKIDQMLGGSAL